jgi:hypothetical protein
VIVLLEKRIVRESFVLWIGLQTGRFELIGDVGLPWLIIILVEICVADTMNNATGDKPGTVVVEIPAKPQWCELRKMYSDGIDEINRGNLSKIFGELMMLIEADKRGKENVIPLAYSQNADEKLM